MSLRIRPGGQSEISANCFAWGESQSFVVLWVGKHNHGSRGQRESEYESNHFSSVTRSHPSEICSNLPRFSFLREW